MGRRNYKYESRFDRPSLQADRNLFLGTLANVAPAVLDSLADEPFRLYPVAEIQGLIRESNPPDEVWGEWSLNTVWKRLQGGQLDSILSLKTLRQALLQWQEDMHLVETHNAEKWLLRSAFFMLDTWHCSEEAFQKRDSTLMVTSSVALDWHTSPTKKGLPAFDGFQDDGESYIERVRQEATKRLKSDTLLSLPCQSHQQDYVKLVVQEASEYWKKADQRYKDNQQLNRIDARPYLKKHMIWAVMFQVLGRTYDQIAKDKKASSDNVRIQVSRVLRGIGLQKRNLPKGRHPEE